MTRAVAGLDPTSLGAALADWLPAQRWFAGKQRPVESIRPRLLGLLGSAPEQLQLWIADVTYVDTGVETYQVPLRAGAGADTGEHGRIGEILGADGDTVTVYDALWDPTLTQAWLLGLTGQHADGHDEGSGSIEFHLTADVDDIPLDAPSKVLNVEQSNTSVVFGDAAILKVFRRLEAGVNPDIEIHEALGRLGNRNIARLLGYVTADVTADVTPDPAEGSTGRPRGGERGGERTWVSLAMLQAFLTTASDGWELAKISVRDLMAEADLHASEAGGDFAAEAFRIGVATAEVHSAMARALGEQALDRPQMQARAAQMSARLDEALEVVPELAENAEALRACYQAFARAEPMIVQRVHGDLHLGQMLRTVQRWVVLDFEGEPVKSIAARRDMDSPLRDVAGMLRSFDYAANHQLIDAGSDSQRRYRATEWADRNRSAFQAGYLHAGGADSEVDPVLLRAFEADKAVYEAVYEARNRPAWLPVPLASVDRLAAPAAERTAAARTSEKEDVS